VSGERLKVVVRVKDRKGGSDGGSGNQAIDKSSYRLTAATTPSIKSCGLFVIHGFSRDEHPSSKQSPKIS